MVRRKKRTRGDGRKKPPKDIKEMTDKEVWEWAAGKVLDWDELAEFIDAELPDAKRPKRK